VTDNKLVCPHCGHDGTPGTSKPPLGSYGFNYLAEGVVCREVCGADSAGRLLLSGDFRCEGAQTANARMECRSCWRTFAVPEGVVLAAPPESSGQPAISSATGQPGALSAEGAAEAIGRNLVQILHVSVEESTRATAVEVGRMEAGIASLTQTVEGLQPLTGDVATLREQAAATAEWQERAAQRLAEQAQSLTSLTGEQNRQRAENAQSLASITEVQNRQQAEQAQGLAALTEEQNRQRAEQAQGLAALTEEQNRQRAEASEREGAAARRFDALEAGLAEVRETVARLSGTFAQVDEALHAGRLRLDAQADVLRALHAAAKEQISRREELREAVQKLEALAAGLEDVKPLPNSL
jgi:hypothetical protein